MTAPPTLPAVRSLGAVPATSAAPAPRRDDASRAVVSRAARPLSVLLLGYPVWWALGVQVPMWPIAALPLLAWLVTNRRQVVLPPGYGVLLLMLGWMLVSGLMLTSVRYAAAYGLRLTLYVAVALMAFFVWNALQRGLSRRTVLNWMLLVWGAAVVLSLPGLLVAPLEFPSPFGTLLRAAGIGDPYIQALTTPQISALDELYDAPRPSPLFAYTNDWAAAVSILTPVAIHGVLTSQGRRRLLIGVLLAVSTLPILISVNRGAWVSIVVAVAYVIGMRVAAGRPRVLVGALAGVGAVGAVIVAVPGLSDLLTDRFTNSNVSTRETLYQASWQLALRSPFFGYGAPQSSEGLADSNDVSIGTHGQFWTTLVSHGIVGAALLIGAIVAIWWHSRPARISSPDLWLHATGVVVAVQTAFYDILPVPLAVALFAMALCGTGRREALHEAAAQLTARTPRTPALTAVHGPDRTGGPDRTAPRLERNDDR